MGLEGPQTFRSLLVVLLWVLDLLPFRLIVESGDKVGIFVDMTLYIIVIIRT